MNVFLAVLWKDLLTEWRSRDRAIAMLLFSLLVVVIFHFSLPGRRDGADAVNGPGPAVGRLRLRRRSWA